MNTKIYHLRNGLPLIYVKNEHSKLLYASLYVNVGAKDVPKDLAGIAHAVEHFLFLGSAHYTQQDINSKPADMGSRIEGESGINYTSFSFRTLRENFEPMLAILADIILYPLFDENAVNAERDVIKAESLANTEQNEDILTEAALSACFEIPLHTTSILGAPYALWKITHEKAREFWSGYYTAPNSVLCICGNCDNIEALAEKYFGSMSSAPSPKFICPEFRSDYRKCRTLADDITLQLIYELPKQYLVAADVLANILGGSDNSRLLRVLRYNKALIYSADCYIETNVGNLMLFVTARCDQTHVLQVTDLICKEIIRICTEEVMLQELTRARNELLTDWIEQSETPTALLEHYGSAFLDQIFMTSEDYTQKLSDISTTDVLEAARHIFRAKPPVYISSGNNFSAYNYHEVLNLLKI